MAAVAHALSHRQLPLEPLLHGLRHRLRLRLDAAAPGRIRRGPLGRRPGGRRGAHDGPARIRRRWCRWRSRPCARCVAPTTAARARPAGERPCEPVPCPYLIGRSPRPEDGAEREMDRRTFAAQGTVAAAAAVVALGGRRAGRRDRPASRGFLAQVRPAGARGRARVGIHHHDGHAPDDRRTGQLRARTPPLDRPRRPRRRASAGNSHRGAVPGPRGRGRVLQRPEYRRSLARDPAPGGDVPGLRSSSAPMPGASSSTTTPTSCSSAPATGRSSTPPPEPSRTDRHATGLQRIKIAEGPDGQLYAV